MSMQTTDLRGLQVLVVEDEMIVALEIEDLLRDAGYEVVGPVGTLPEALDLARNRSLDAAILDINLDGQWSVPVAVELQRRSIPFILATGYADSALPAHWRDLPRLMKPFNGGDLAKVMETILQR
ncbi:response regulator [Povalibacter sp.]|uniref:response regulator n=1 Tax=Povalibacter sp. TaxID=1962978 RepID=UPI002F407C09